MKEVHIPNFNYSNIQWIESDKPKYKKRSRDAYPYCVNCKKNHPEKAPKTYVYENAMGGLHYHCHRCGNAASIAQIADAVIF